MPNKGHVIPLREAVRAWFSISWQTFGGPAGQIAVMQHKLVDDKRWISQRRFLHALNFCHFLPGPEAHQLAIYTGWLLNGWIGGMIAGILFVIPGAVAILGLSALYIAAGSTAVVTGLFAGVAPAVVAIVAHALQRVASRALGHPILVALAVTAFIALAFFKIPFPVVVLTAGALGWALSRKIPELRRVKADPSDNGPAPLISDDALHQDRPSHRRSLLIILLGAMVWLAPVGLAALVFSPQSVFVDQGLFFSGAAIVTFGGAYAVLAYVAQQAVNVFHWLAPGEMVKGLALAETTPGPLIMVVQFVAFVGAYRNPGNLDPWAAAVLASVLVTWVTFVPSFLFVFLGAPYLERLRGKQHVAAALTGITAGVVGTIADISLYFTEHTLFNDVRALQWGPIQLDVPVWASWNPVALAITALACLLIFWRKWATMRTLGLCSGIGLGIGTVTMLNS
uniref:Chromate transport protein n=1 Tax=Arthrobacter sp. Chr15 TaxID=447032 RepID=A6YFR6_9MICC|nr:chromate efflux transporter [Arthrobacter sp. Chr15]ABR67077.1 chromate transport protein [Arthrobacter sp. Chr15]